MADDNKKIALTDFLSTGTGLDTLRHGLFPEPRT